MATSNSIKELLWEWEGGSGSWAQLLFQWLIYRGHSCVVSFISTERLFTARLVFRPRLFCPCLTQFRPSYSSHCHNFCRCTAALSARSHFVSTVTCTSTRPSITVQDAQVLPLPLWTIAPQLRKMQSPVPPAKFNENMKFTTELAHQIVIWGVFS